MKLVSYYKEDQDQLAFASHQNAAKAYDEGFFKDLVIPFHDLKKDGTVRGDTSLEKLAKLKPAFEAAHTGVRVSLNLAASSVIARQIRAQAPVDVFFSADENNMDTLATAGLIDNATRRDIVGNKLVLIVPANAKTHVATLKDLATSQVKVIALCDASVPVGGYARRWLDKAGLTAQLQSKIVKPDNVRATLALVQTGAANAGFVYATDVTAAGDKVRVVDHPSASDGIEVRYPAAAVKASSHPADAKAIL